AGVVRMELETGESRFALAMALDGNGRWCRLDPRQGARLAVAEAARKVAATGAQPLAATNCLNFGNPEKPEVMWQLAEAIAGLGEACRALGTPITGGNVSLYNETLGQGIQPTPVLGVVGRLELAPGQAPLGARFPAAGLDILLLSAAPDQTADERRRRFGSSEYAAVTLGHTWGAPPELDLERELKLHQLLRHAFQQGWLASAHQVSTGGLAVAMVECCLNHRAEQTPLAAVGAAVELPADDAMLALFEESAGRVLVSCPPAHRAVLQAAAQAAGLAAVAIGTTLSQGLQIEIGGQQIIRLSGEEMAAAWEPALEAQLA
ncbi:MAG TPA: AIR synthase related protein, partial [Terriglobales bacterium]|nr:AIR synthase related protein [Terriglobales bacterium]